MICKYGTIINGVYKVKIVKCLKSEDMSIRPTLEPTSTEYVEPTYIPEPTDTETPTPNPYPPIDITPTLPIPYPLPEGAVNWLILHYWSK